MSGVLPVAFVASHTGPWQITQISPVVGESLPAASHLTLVEGQGHVLPDPAVWCLRGVVSHLRYTGDAEVQALRARQQPLGRPEARCAALIPIRKNAAWWALPQDVRRAIVEEQSHHIAIGLNYLPGIARRLHHGRDLGEPFDFLTWFDYAPEQASAFEALVAKLRATEEWRYVDREVDIRLERVG